MGSGVSGQVGFPSYIEDAHDLFLYGANGSLPTRAVDPDLIDLVTTYVQSANSPYSGESAYDPDDRITTMEGGTTALKTKLDGLARRTDWDNHISTALSKAIDEFGITRLKSQVRDVLNVSSEHLTPQIDATFLTTKSQITTLLTEGADEILPIVQDVLDQITQDNDAIDDLVENYEESNLPTHLRSVNRFAGVFFMGNAVHTSTFAMGIGQLERDFDRQVHEYRLGINRDFRDKYLSIFAQLLSAYIQSGVQLTQAQIGDHLQNYRQWLTAYLGDEANKNQFVNVASGEMTRMLSAETAGYQGYAAVNTETERIATVIKKEQFDANIELDVLDGTWPFDVMIRGTQVLAGLNGAPLVPEKPSKIQSAAGGALSGAAMGAQVTGGNPIGIVAGGLLGLGASLLD